MDLDAIQSLIETRFTEQEDELFKTDLLTLVEKVRILEVENVRLQTELNCGDAQLRRPQWPATRLD